MLITSFTPNLGNAVSSAFISENGGSNSLSLDTQINAQNETLYLNNASKIAPYSITIAPSTPKNEKDTENMTEESLFMTQLSTIIQEILPPSFWNIPAGGHQTSYTCINTEKECFHDRFETKPLNGGLSNHLFTVKNKYTNNSVLVRIHPSPNGGEGEEAQVEHQSDFALVDREYENRVLSFLSKHKIGPIFYGRFQNGRLEEFYDGYKTIQFNEMSTPKYARGIAVEMSNLHSLQMAELKGMNDENKNQNEDGNIFNRIDSWLNISKQLFSVHGKKSNEVSHKDLDKNVERIKETRYMTQKDILTLKLMLQTIDTEWKWYQHEMRNQDQENPDEKETTSSIEQKARKFCHEIVFTHMDCQSLNILAPKSSSSSKKKSNDDDKASENDVESVTVRLIDFEYAGFNRRVIDIANTFLEHCNMNDLKPNYEKEYPSNTQQNLFLESYLRQCCYNDSKRKNNKSGLSTANTESLQWLHDLMFSDIEESSDNDIGLEGKEIFLEALHIEIAKHTLFSHLEWSCWSIIQSMQSNIDFDYIRYAELRMKGYFHFKNMCW